MLKIQEQHEIEMNHINSLNYCQWSYMWKRVILVLVWLYNIKIC